MDSDIQPGLGIGWQQSTAVVHCLAGFDTEVVAVVVVARQNLADTEPLILEVEVHGWKTGTRFRMNASLAYCRSTRARFDGLCP